MKRQLYMVVERYLKKENIVEFVRFGFVGVINTLVDFSVFILLTSFVGVGYLIGQIVGYSAGVANSFVMNRVWTFKRVDKDKDNIFRELTQFIVINLLSLGATLSAMRILLEVSSYSPIVIKVIVTIIGQIINYLGYKFWVFK